MARATQLAQNIRALSAKISGLLARVSALKLPPPVRFTGDASEKEFTLPQGKTPWQVFLESDYQIEGSQDDYTVENDGFRKTIKFVIAPGNGVIVNIYPQELS